MKKINGGSVGFWWVIVALFALAATLYGVYSVEFRQTEVELVGSELTMPTEPLAEYVYFVIVDGLRVDGMEEMPYLRDLASRGSYGVMEVEMPTFSRPAYARIITGASSSVTGINGNFQVRKLHLPTIYDTATGAGLRTGASAYHWFYELTVDEPYRTSGSHENRSIADSSLPVQYGYYYDDFDFTYDDEEIFLQGKKIMLEHNPNLMLVHSMEVDQMGHDYGGVSDEYRDAARRNDSYIRDFVEAIPSPADSIVIVTGDHGHIDRGGHGGPEKPAVEVPLVIFGKGVNNSPASGYTQLDIAPTLSALLGLPFTAYMEGRIMVEPFDWRAGVAENKAELLSEVHRPFVEKMYETAGVSYDDGEVALFVSSVSPAAGVSYTDGPVISISNLKEILHEETVNIRKMAGIIAGAVILMVALLGFRLYRLENLKTVIREKGTFVISGLVATAVFVTGYRYICALFHISYSYSIIEPNVGFFIKLTLAPLIAFAIFFVFYKVVMARKGSPAGYRTHVWVLFSAMFAVMGVALVYMNGNEIFIPDLEWYLVFAFTGYHLFLTALFALPFRRFAGKGPEEERVLRVR